MMQGERAEDRAVIGLTGADALEFLQGLVTNDLRPLGKGEGAVWAAMLTPQGKYLADFLVVNTDGRLLIDVKDSFAPSLLKRLTMYRLRADVQLGILDLPVVRGLGEAPAGALPDPRHPALGWRRYGGAPGGDPVIDWDAIRVEHLIPETGIELIPDDSYILEMGFEPLHGVDFRKGCYVGQEVTARMKHKTELRKGLARVRISGSAAPGAEITAGDRPAGTLFTRSGDRALAWLRFDRAGAEMQAARHGSGWTADGRGCGQARSEYSINSVWTRSPRPDR
jgi:tRNA-modifying protein YgfZ